MSWGKAVENCSAIDAVVKTLEILGVPFFIEILGEVCIENSDSVSIRRLQYSNWAFLERYVRYSEFQIDDCIISHRFSLLDEPLYWEIEVLGEEDSGFIQNISLNIYEIMEKFGITGRIIACAICGDNLEIEMEVGEELWY